ncbi:MAG: hypothetical protein NEA02_06960 [Thermoanaerobaculia bacterium]|nr:hypothetical protein [Thermoanaerobaculia bacterium]
MKILIAFMLSIALLAREMPASAAAPDLSEARRRFIAAVQASDKDVAAAEAALDDLIRKASPLLTGSDQKKIDEMQKALKAVRDFKAEKARILTRDLGTREKLLKAAEDYARACQVMAAVIIVVVAVVAIVVAVFTAGASPALVAGAVVSASAACAALVAVTAALAASLPEISKALDEVAITSFAGARAAIAQANAAARDALSRLPAAPKPVVLVRKELERVALAGAAFEGELGGSFHVELENGQVTRPAGEASLHGTIVITSKTNANVKLTLEGDATLTAGGSGGAWASLVGHGTARLTGFGGSLTILNATIESQGAFVLTLSGGDVSVRGCTHSVHAGSRVSGNELSLAGSLRCGSWTLASSTLKLEGGGVSGSATFSAWSRSFSMTYSAAGDGLRARGSISGSDTSWARIPGVGAEFKIENPKLGVKLEGGTLSPTFEADGVKVRTTAKKPDGGAWASATLNLSTVVAVPAPPASSVPVPFPNLPTPGDVFKAARETCEAGARLIPLADARNTALAACRVDHPSPPAIPSLPDRLNVPVSEIFQ